MLCSVQSPQYRYLHIWSARWFIAQFFFSHFITLELFCSDRMAFAQSVQCAYKIKFWELRTQIWVWWARFWHIVTCVCVFFRFSADSLEFVVQNHCFFSHFLSVNKPCLPEVASLNMCSHGDKQLFRIHLCKKRDSCKWAKVTIWMYKIYFNRISTFSQNLCALSCSLYGLMIKDMKKKTSHKLCSAFFGNKNVSSNKQHIELTEDKRWYFKNQHMLSVHIFKRITHTHRAHTSATSIAYMVLDQAEPLGWG